MSIKVKTGKVCDLSMPLTVADVSPTGERTQYVNLPGDGYNGRFVEVSATITPAVAGRTVHFELVAVGGNIDPSKLVADARAGLGTADSGALPITATAQTNEIGVAELTLRLSTYGGDKFKVAASLSDTMSDAETSGEIQVWRKVYYEIEVVADAPDGTSNDLPMGNIEAEYERAFVELERVVNPNEPVPYEEKFTKPMAIAAVRDRFGAQHSPNQISVLMGSKLVRVEFKSFTDQATSNTVTLGPFIPWADDDWYVVCEAIELDLAPDGSPITPPSRSENVLEADITLVNSTAPPLKFARIALAGHGFDPVNKLVAVKLDVKHMKEIGVAWGGTPFAYIPVGSVRLGNWTSGAQDRELMAEGITAHEIGHKLLMVPGSSDYWYDSPGVGPHCMHPHASKGAYDASQAHACTMHHTALGTRTFCDACIKALRKNLLRSADTGWGGTRGPDAEGAPF